MAAKPKKKKSPPGEVLARNRSASHEYHLLSRIEAGIVLLGTEVKSAREGRVQLKEAYARIQNGEVTLYSAHFSPYSHGTNENHDPLRPRRLLLHAGEIRKLAKQVGSGGVTLVPTLLYLKNGKIKVELAVARGKKQYDKRDDKRKQEADREMARARTVRQVH